MADYTLFKRLKKLFSNDVIIRNVGGKQIKVADINKVQSSGNLATNAMVDRYAKIFSSKMPVSGFAPGEASMLFRKEMFTDYEAMETDSIIASYLDIVADECTTKDEFGDTLTIRSDNEKISKILHNLFYDILNIEFNLWPWARNLCKYGDAYLKLKLVEKFGIIGVDPVAPYQMIRDETPDEEGNDGIRFKIDPSGMGAAQYSSHVSQQEELENYEVAHFRLLSDTNFLPYGKSILEPARKVWKQLTLMEDAMLIHRIMRAPEKRIFNVDVAGIPPHEVDAYMQKIIQNTKKIPFQDPTSGEYNLKFNMQNSIEDFYIPRRGSDAGTTIETAPGLQYEGITDVEYLRNRMLAALRVPKAFLNYEEGLSGKATLAAEDVRFSRTIERIQRIIISELYKIAIIHLYIQGFEDAELLNFEIGMTAPSTIYEREKIELWQSKITLAKDMMEAGLLSQEFIYKNILHLTDDDYALERQKVLDDARYKFRLTQLTEEGNDPVKTGKSFGTAHDIASLYKGDEGVPDGYDEHDLDDDDAPKQKKNTKTPEKIGRPKSNDTYGTHKHPYGFDPLGKKEYGSPSKLADAIDRKFKKSKRIITESLKTTELGSDTKNKLLNLLDESNIIDPDQI